MADTSTPNHSASDEPETSASGSPIYRYEGVEPAPFELATGDENTIVSISSHIERHLGETSGVFHELISDKVHLDVHIVPPSADYPFYILVTSGMSDRPMTVPAGPDETPPYAELCILLPSTWRLPTDPGEMAEAFQDEDVYWPIRWLKMLGRFPHEYHTWLGAGHTIPNGEEAVPFAPGTELGCMLLLSSISLPEDFQTLDVSPGKTVHFYTLYPLYREEMELKMAEGVDALLDRFEEYDISDVVDPTRVNAASDFVFPQ